MLSCYNTLDVKFGTTMIFTEQRLYWLIIAITFVYILNLLSPILGPFLFSVLLAYLGDPIVDRLEKYISRTLSVVIVFFVILLMLVLTVLIFIPLITEDLSSLLKKVPDILTFIYNKIMPIIQKHFSYELGVSKDVIINIIKDNINDLPMLIKKGLFLVTNSSGLALSFLANVLLVPVVTFYLLRDWDNLVFKASTLLPRHYESKITQIIKESNHMLSAFLRGQFAVMNALALIYTVGLSIVGLDSAILIGLIAGWLSFVPYLGLIVGFSVATLLSYFQFNDFAHPIGVIIVFLVAQGLEASFLTPRFVGERIGLHPVAVIFAILAGGHLAGFSGVLLALPVAAVLNVLISHIQGAYQQSSLYNNSSKNIKEDC